MSVKIFIGGKELERWTEMTLSRSKNELTGQLSVSLFFDFVPSAPVAINATRGKEITVYIGGQLSFTGKIDKRQGSGAKKGEQGTDTNPSGEASISSSIGPDEYTVKLTARGKTKYLVGASHQHKTTNMLKPTNKEAIEELIKPWGLEIDWKAETIKLDKVRFRDGNAVVDELRRIAVENGHFIYETRDGKLRITDDTGREEGEPLVLGLNILRFSAEQSEEEAKSKVKVKGQRTKKGQWGRDAIINTQKEIEDKWVEANIPMTIQHYGDGTDQALERRANFETNWRSSMSKKVNIDVFHVQTSTGEPWDVGTLHYVEVPPEGIFDMMEITELTYTVKNDKDIHTSLTLSPPPKSSANANGGVGSALSNVAQGATSIGNARRAAAGISFVAGQYPAPWGGPDIAFLDIANEVASAATGLLDDLAASVNAPPLSLPRGRG